MKHLKNIAIPLIAVLLAGATGCTKDFDDMNTDPYKPTETSENFLFNSVLSSINEGAYSTFLYDYVNVYTPVSQLMARVDAPDDSRKPVHSSGIDGPWGNYYGTLKNIREIQSKLDAKTNQGAVKNKRALLNIIFAFYTLRVTDEYGDMPYSKASLGFQTNNQVFYGPYDDQQSIYKDCLTNLKWAVDNMVIGGDGQESYGSLETFLAGNYTKWAKLANALRLRYALRLVDKDAAYAKTVIQEVLASSMKPTSTDNYLLYPYNGSDNMSYDGYNWAMREANNSRLGTNMYNVMTAAGTVKDPRMQVFFSPAKGGLYVPLANSYGARPAGISVKGNPYGGSAGTDSSNYSPMNYGLIAANVNTAGYYLMTYPEYKLLEAEAYARPEIGLVDLTKAKAAYDEGVKSSVKFWYDVIVAKQTTWPNKPTRPTDTDIDALVAAGGFYEFSSATAVQKIYTQRFIHYIRQPDQAWALWRQNAYSPRENIIGGNGLYNVVRLTYPSTEAERNTTNWQAEITKLGSDLTTVKVWWDAN